MNICFYPNILYYGDCFGICTAIRNLGHCLNQEYAIQTLSVKAYPMAKCRRLTPKGRIGRGAWWLIYVKHYEPKR